MKKLFLLLLPALLCGCPNVEGQDDDYSYSYSYDMIGNGCRTGRLIFHSLNELCQCLQDEEINNYCARPQRAREYSLNCTGVFTLVENCRD